MTRGPGLPRCAYYRASATTAKTVCLLVAASTMGNERTGQLHSNTWRRWKFQNRCTLRPQQEREDDNEGDVALQS